MKIGGGIAYINQLCGSHASASAGWGYAVCGAMKGGLAWGGVAGSSPAGVVWDSYCVMHELGHVFGAVSREARRGGAGAGVPGD